MPAFSGQEEETPSHMPTVTANSARTTRKGAKTASRKAASRRATSASRARKATSASRARKVTARKPGPAKSKRAKVARARAASQARAAVRQAETATRLSAADRSAVFGDYAERAVLIPVGAALTARDRVISSVNGTIATYSTPSKAQAQLRRFERRGATARNRLERE